MNDTTSLTIHDARIIDVDRFAVERLGDSGRRFDVRIEGEHISHVVPHGSELPLSDQNLGAEGLILSPGFVDLHVHLREPGFEESETIETASRAAALGGFTAVVAMPNTEPPQDSRTVVEFVRRRGRHIGLCDVHPAGCITLGRLGLQLAPMAEMRSAGVRLFTDDGTGVQDPLIMRRALEYAKDLDVTLAQHCEVSNLTKGAVMNEGECCSRLGLPGWPALAEILMLQRDIELVRLTGTRMHFLHMSTARSVQLVRQAKEDGLPVTAEAAPHHFTLSDAEMESFDPVFKVNPPLRTPEDIEALKQGLRDGTIDAIATDHAPHADHLKEQSLDMAPPGMVGLETALALAVSELDMPIADVVAAMSWRPAAIAGIDDRHGRAVVPGEVANLTIFDPSQEWVVTRDGLASKSRNTPYAGRKVRGRVRHTVQSGRLVVTDGRLVR